MKLIKPKKVTTAMLVSTTAVEAYAEYNPATAYALDSYVVRASTGRAYRCIQGPATARTPETSPLYWVDVGPTNAMALFDDQTSTETTATSSLTVVIAPGFVNSFAVLGVAGSTVQVTATDGPGGAVVFTKTVTLDRSIIDDWYKYFTVLPDPQGDVVVDNLPTYYNMRLSVTITGTAVRVGSLIVGTVHDLGEGEFGQVTLGITDYSRRTTNAATGVTTFVKGRFTRKRSYRVLLPTRRVRQVNQALEDVRSTLCVWMGGGEWLDLPLILAGVYSEFSIAPESAEHSRLTIDIDSTPLGTTT